jgi:uncharacterized secreted repeat protein (TIGR03808 family)
MDRRRFLAAAAALTAAWPASAGPRAGLVPGSPDDQTQAMARALKAAADAGQPLALQPGRYRVSGLELPPNAALVGVPGATVLESAGSGALLRGGRGARLRLSGLTLDGLSRPLNGAGALVEVESVSNLAIEDCEIAASAGTGLRISRCGGRVIRCLVRDAASAGIHAQDSTGLEISDNRVRDCADNGILVWTSSPREDGTRVSRNRIERIGARSGGTGQYGNGVNVFRAGSVIVEGNVVTDCAFSAVRDNGGSNVQIVANNCARLGEVALYVEFGFQGAVVANNVVDTAAAGISITNFNEGGRLASCSGNVVRNLHFRDGEKLGFGIAAEADTAVTGNVVENAPFAGIWLGWGQYLRDVSATGNIVRTTAFGIGVSVAPGAGGALIADNLVAGARKGAVVGFEWDRPVTGDLARDGAERYPRLTVTRNRVG